VEFFFFAILMFLTTVVFGVMSLFYKYVNGSGVTMHEATDADSLHLTAAAESLASEPQTDSDAKPH